MIIIWTDDAEHLNNVLKWLKEYNLKASLDKCEFLDRITYWKHEISILSLQKIIEKFPGRQCALVLPGNGKLLTLVLA